MVISGNRVMRETLAASAQWRNAVKLCKSSRLAASGIDGETPSHGLAYPK
jgi:hypothetical protein